MIDSHCHLADEMYAQELPAIVERTRAAGFERVMVILEAGNRQEEQQAGDLRSLWPEVRVGVGVHPHHAKRFEGNEGSAAVVVREQIARTPYARAVGEIGLDYHYDFSPPPVQQGVFRAQVALARELGLPVIIHTREAEDDTLSLLKSAGAGELRGVLHCFTGTRALANAALDLGFYISLAGIVTFPKGQELRDIARDIPSDRLLLETDSPFLAPVPHRGRRNEPMRMVHTAETIASVRGVSVAELDRITTANFHALFRP
jgi:TatD DNase family protein